MFEPLSLSPIEYSVAFVVSLTVLGIWKRSKKHKNPSLEHSKSQVEARYNSLLSKQTQPSSQTVLSSTWYPFHPEDSIEMAGLKFNYGLVYWNEEPLPQSLSHSRHLEPSAILSCLPVQKLSNQAPPKLTVESTDQLSYETLSPRQRFHYLHWLSGNRDTPEMEEGYVLLYFMGLERRLMLETCEHHWLSLIMELYRLRAAYPYHQEFQEVSTHLLKASVLLKYSKETSLAELLQTGFSAFKHWEYGWLFESLFDDSTWQEQLTNWQQSPYYQGFNPSVGPLALHPALKYYPVTSAQPKPRSKSASPSLAMAPSV